MLTYCRNRLNITHNFVFFGVDGVVVVVVNSRCSLLLVVAILCG